MPEAEDRPRRYALPVGVSLIVIGAAPFMGQLRDALKEAFPDEFVTVLAALVAAGVMLALGAAARRIREHRARRCALLALAIVLFATYAVLMATGNADVDAVERVHFLEYGLVAALFHRAERWRGGLVAFVLAMLWGTLVGIVDEWVQWLVPVRSGDVRDVGLNAFAAGCGVLFALSLMPPSQRSADIDPAGGRVIRWLSAVALLAFGVFFHAAHLGYEIEDEEGLRFRSGFTREALLEAQRTRAAVWREHPPLTLPTLAVEDFYMTEGGWRVQHRNGAMARGDHASAWKENRILEKYYDPFLDLRSFIGNGAIHRWPPEQRAEVEEASTGLRHTLYLSPAGLDRIYTSPGKPVFWAMIIGGVVALLSWPFGHATVRQP